LDTGGAFSADASGFAADGVFAGATGSGTGFGFVVEATAGGFA
jgi:hypothetical protein